MKKAVWVVLVLAIVYFVGGLIYMGMNLSDIELSRSDAKLAGPEEVNSVQNVIGGGGGWGSSYWCYDWFVDMLGDGTCYR
ncbi:MAG: hypothetical protein UT69_C0032G0006 [Candidatus Yanofskybacteria bacterium GW2011_GWE1_40_10]|uniref:Uncharacterized protein n=1 Tax=Candidatus Yanofskybacteria bacterium GW2011_GWE2_40_11 TaxID=1619033 RepID=A0A0G0QHQ6_9BACT|nr:MAG: hypothetical protein UT69_C0032G0006 [Candidatus Yanofskybacteria bacterium GW2011_GWE1_40_10]KKR39648.1 MAG: hypothetical protein UT75_C0016G0006 [Candidatus Yanofskybacteria bacterium GW2011_GWE2_40_11]